MYSSVDLVPPLFDNLDDFVKSDRTVSLALSPVANSLAAFAAPAQLGAKTGSSGGAEEQDVYIASWNTAPSSERRLFTTDTSTIFAALQGLLNNVALSGIDLPRSGETISAVRKLVGDYIRHIEDCWVQTSQPVPRPKDDPLEFSAEHYRTMYTSFSLFQCLYLPEDGIDDVPVGDELLEWLNIHFFEPSTEEGDQLSSLDHPWEDETFWPYVLRATIRGLSKAAVFFLQGLSRHPSEELQGISERLVTLLEKHPRQRQYSTEKEFFVSSRRWRDRAKALRLELDRVPDDDRHDGFYNWWENVSDILGVLEGRGEVLQRVCGGLGGDWKEVVCTWGVWTDVALRRADLPDLVARVIFDMQPDPTDQEDSLHAELFQGHSSQILSRANEIDIWLSAHMADLMAPLGLIDADIDEETEFTTRDQYILPYAEYLYSDPSLWRLTVDYYCTCGEIGKKMADEVLIRVPLQLESGFTQDKGKAKDDKSISKDDTMDVQEEEADLAGVVKELNATCFQYRREPVRRMICRIAAQKLTDLKKYSLAVSYCRSAEDWPGLGRIVDHVLEEFISQGPQHFASLVADIVPTLQELPSEPGPHSVFVHRLMFAVRYAEFHQRVLNGDLQNAALDLISLFEEGLAPKSWWGVLLNDATPLVRDERALYFSSGTAALLLRHLEEVTIKTKQDCGDDYLAVLGRIVEINGTREVLKRLDILRLALARYFARCTIGGSTIFAGVNKVGRDA